MNAQRKSARKKWYEKYLPFVAKSPEIQAEWLAAQLSRLRSSAGEEQSGVLSQDEIKPYIRLLLENSSVGEVWAGEDAKDEGLVTLLDGMGADNLLLMLECAEIYDVPKLFGLLRHPSRQMAITAMKKVPPPYEKNPLLIVDRVFQAIRGKSSALLAEAAEGVLSGDSVPVDFAYNYERFREIMMDEHILSLLYPKAK